MLKLIGFFSLAILIGLYVLFMGMVNDVTCAGINMPGNPLLVRIGEWLLLACFI